MQAVVNVVLPVFAIVLAGFACGRLRLLGPGGSEALNGFVYFAALPALFFGSLAKVELSQIFNWPYLIAFLLGMLATALAALIVGLYILWIEAERSTASHRLHVARDAFAGVFKSPLVLSAIAGILCSGLGVPVPAPLLTFCDIMGAAAPPAALFAMGLFMVGKSFKGDLVEVGAFTALKLILHPLATFAIVAWLIPVEPSWRDVLLLMAALPTGSLVFVLASQNDTYVRRATGIILGSTLASIVTLSWLLDYLGV